MIRRRRRLHGTRFSTGAPRAAEGVTHEFREIYRPRPRFRPVGAIAGAARGPSAVHPRASAEGAARRPGRPGGRADRPRRRQFPPGARARSRRRWPSCRRSRAAAPARSISLRRWRALFDAAEKVAEKAGDSFVTVERLLLALALEKDSEAGKVLPSAGVTPQSLNAAIEALRKGRTADTASAEKAYDALKKYARDLTEAARDGKLDPVIGRDEEIRRTIQVLSRRTKNNPGADRRARRRQDRHRRRPGAAHRQRRRAGEPARTRSCWRSTWAR